MKTLISLGISLLRIMRNIGSKLEFQLRKKTIELVHNYLQKYKSFKGVKYIF